jgi:hypothetical protein
MSTAHAARTASPRVRVLSVESSTTCPDTDGAVDAEIEIDGVHVGGVTIIPDHSQSTVGRCTQLGTCGTPLEGWASSGVADIIDEIEHEDEHIRQSLIAEIVGAVQRAADAADLT